MRACALYVLSGGATASPTVLQAALRARTERASLRAFGLNALAALVRQLSQCAAAATATAAANVIDDDDYDQQQQQQQQQQYAGHSAVAEALVFLRPALQCTRATTSSSSTVTAANTSLLPTAAAAAAQRRRHHCLTGLEGCSAAAAHSTHCAFTALYTQLGALLTDALVTRRPQTRLAHLLMTAWAIDLEPRDAAAVASAGVLPALQRLASLTAAADIAASRQSALLQSSSAVPPATATSSSTSANSSAAVQWQPWSQQGVREGVLKGVVLGRDLARHISALPGGAVPQELLVKLNLQRDPPAAATAGVADGSADSEELQPAGTATAAQLMARHSVQSLAAAYGELVEVYIGQVSHAVNDFASLTTLG
jgi:hypothetical protein